MYYLSPISKYGIKYYIVGRLRTMTISILKLNTAIGGHLGFKKMLKSDRFTPTQEY